MLFFVRSKARLLAATLYGTASLAHDARTEKGLRLLPGVPELRSGQFYRMPSG